MILGYNTNGLAHHDLFAAVEMLAEIGYRGVAVTIDHAAVSPYKPSFGFQSAELRRIAELHSMTLVIETGARYLLNPREKHEPTLVSPDAQSRKFRETFLLRAITAAELSGAKIVSIWSGVVRDGADRDRAMRRLVDSMNWVLEKAAEEEVTLAFEPEPGMLIETLSDYSELRQRLGDAGMNINRLKLTVDIGHLHCLGEVPIPDYLEQYAGEIANVHIEDMRQGVHEHLQFGEGEIDFPPVVASLNSIGYDGPINVELSRHSHEGPIAAQRAYDFLEPLFNYG